MTARSTARYSRLIDAAWRMAFRLGFPVAVSWWRLRRPRHEGVLVAVYVGASLLLVRSSYRIAWNFPGGSIRRGETPESAARRELAEEVGLVAHDIRPHGVVCGIWDGRRDTVQVFELRLDGPPTMQLDNREIVEARLLSPEELFGMRLTGPVAAYLDQSGIETAPP